MVWRPVVLWVFATPALAAPVVIFDAGNTQSIARYLESVTVERPPVSRAGTEPATPVQPSGFDKRRLLPIRTPEMTPGRLVQKALEPAQREPLARLTQPVFLIGADPQSLQWLAQHRKQLKALGAVGMLVQADTAEELAAVERMGKDLVIMPASGSMLAHFLGLRHYPVLISRQGIEQ